MASFEILLNLGLSCAPGGSALAARRALCHIFLVSEVFRENRTMKIHLGFPVSQPFSAATMAAAAVADTARPDDCEQGDDD
jgi:hypothetical protein